MFLEKASSWEESPLFCLADLVDDFENALDLEDLETRLYFLAFSVFFFFREFLEIMDCGDLGCFGDEPDFNSFLFDFLGEFDGDLVDEMLLSRPRLINFVKVS